ncbi:MAG TPA: chemotaxis protein CheW [Aridibacter sp.]|nr:chemotaxis protein CheW [Aridibacter sp.]
MTNDSAGNPVRRASRDASRTIGRQAHDEPLTVSQSRKFIVFVVGGSNFAVDSQTVTEVLRDLSPARLPNTPGWLLGIANLRSEIVTVVELEELLGGDKAPGTPSPKHIVVRLETMDALIAFRVEKLREIITIEKSKVRPAAAASRPFESGEFKHNGEPFTVINVGKLVESLKLV